jgi:hypothetical protein
LANNFTVMVETAIETTNKFRVMERRQLGNLVQEQAMAGSGMVTTNTPGKTGGFEGVDYLIYGSITSGSVSRKHDMGASFLLGALSGRAVDCAKAVATLVVNIKITDARSGEVKYAKEITETNESSSSCNGTAEVDSTGLLKDAASKVANGLVMAVYPIQIAAVQPDGSFVLNYGEGSITPGSYFAIYQKGEEIKDPASGEVIGSNETKLGVIQVSEVTGRFSRPCRLRRLPPLCQLDRLYVLQTLPICHRRERAADAARQYEADRPDRRALRRHGDGNASAGAK